MNPALYAVLVGLIGLGWLMTYFSLRKRLEREIAARDPATEVREELRSIMVEINRTTEQNVAIIEDKIEQLSQLMKEADRKIGLLRRETEKNEVSRQVYSRVFRAPPAVASGGVVAVGSEKSAESRSVGSASAGSEKPVGEAAAGEPAEAVVEPLEARILRLSREGFSAEMIAGRVGSTASEVQLIISLAGRRR